MKGIAILMVFTISFLFSINANAYALLLSDDPVGDTDLVVVGTIVTANPKFDSQNYHVPETEYVAYIEEIIKGWDLFEDGNKTKSIRFDSPGSVDYDGPFHRGSSKIFNVGDRGLLMLNQKNGTFQESLWSRTTESDCSGNELIQLMNAPAGLHLFQNNKDYSPFYTNQTITAQYYLYNKNLTASTVDVTLDVIPGFPAIHHPTSLSLNLDKCQAYAMGETEFVIEKPGSFSLYSIVNGEEGDSFGGIKVIDHIDSPRKQFSSGISIDKIQCKDHLALIQKYDGSPACVKPNSVSKFVTREWGTSDDWIKISNADKSIHYELEHAKISYVLAFSDYSNPGLPEESKEISLQIGLIQTQDGLLKITLPRNLIDSKINNLDDGFFVLLDGMETDYTETKTESKRTLEFSFTPENHFIEIIGYGYHNAELSPFDDRLSELYRQCNTDKPGSIWNDEEKYCSYTTILRDTGHHTIPSPEPAPNPTPEPEPISEEKQLERQLRLAALNKVQEILQTDYRGNEIKINAIQEYVDNFESDYFMNQFLYALENEYKKDDLIGFVFTEWGYQNHECTSPVLKMYLKPYNNYKEFGSIEKIYQWQNPGYCDPLESYLDGNLILNYWRMPDIPPQFQSCTVPGEYKIFASSIDGETPEPVGSFTCQSEMLEGEPQPWMELPE